MIDRPAFFDAVRASLFGGAMTQEQVNGCAVFLDWFDRENPPIPDAHHMDERMLAYVLATMAHETAWTCLPIPEYGKGKGRAYSKPCGPYKQRYYGRGYVQITHLENYAAQDRKLGLEGELVKHPDLALDPEIAKRIILYGMLDGDFTSRRLGDYITSEACDFYNARRIVNGVDRAADIAGYAEQFLAALAPA